MNKTLLHPIFRINTDDFKYRTIVTRAVLISSAFVFLFAHPINAQTGPQLTLEKTVGIASQQTGETVTYTIIGGCSDLENNCTGAIMTDTLPPELEFITAGPIFVESGNPPMLENVPYIYDPVSNSITWDFTSLFEAGMPAGTSFSIEVEARIRPGDTPNGANISNEIIFESDDDYETSTADVVAQATPQWDISKTVTTGPIYHDQDVNYQIELQNTGGISGNLNLENIVITDTLPPGAVYQGSNPMGVYDMVENTVSWTLPSLEVTTTSLTFDLTVQYPFSDMVNNNTGLTTPIAKTNKVNLTADPIGEPPLILDDEASDPLLPPVFSIGLVKTAMDNQSLVLEETNYFELVVSNTGTAELDEFTLVDNIPDQFNLEHIVLQGFPTDSTVNVQVQLNGATMWTSWLVGVSPSGALDLSTIPGYDPSMGDYVSAIEFNFGTVPPGFVGSILVSVSPAYDMAGLDNAGNSVDLYQLYYNVASASAINPFDMSPVNSGSVSDFMCIIEKAGRAAPGKTVASTYVPGEEPAGVSTTGNPYYTGSKITYTLHVENDGTDGNLSPYLTGSTGFEPISNPIVADLLPAGLTFIPSSVMMLNNTSTLTLPSFVKVADYNSTGDTLFRWQFTGDLLPGESFDITFDAFINPDVTPYQDYTNSYCLSSETSDIVCDGPACGETIDLTTTGQFDLDNFFLAPPALSGVNESCCASVTITVVDSIASPTPDKMLLSSGTFAPTGTAIVEAGLAQDTVEYLLTFGNDDMANFILPNPIGFDLLPDQLEYVPGSISLVSNTTGLGLDDSGGNPGFEIIPDYSGTGRTLLRWSFTGDFPIGSAVQYQIKTVIRPGAIGSVTNSLGFTTNEFLFQCNAPSQPVQDQFDLDGDTDTSEDLCFTDSDPFIIGTITSMSANKFVQGANDTAFLRLPDIASTNDDDFVYWKLRISNPGNQDLTEVVVVDIFPYIGDVGVQLNTADRASEWRPFLVENIRLPTGLDGTLSYSTSTNPCRPEIDPTVPTPCDDNWVDWPASLTLTPAELEAVQAIKIEWNDGVPLLPTEEFDIDVTMRSPPPPSPVGTGTIAWNSLARNAAEIPAQEPNKVGVRLDRMDLALRKILAPGQLKFVSPGDTIEYIIEVHNQGSFIADSIQVTDFFPSDLSLISTGWTVGPMVGGLNTLSHLLTAADGSFVDPQGLLPGEFIEVPISFVLSPFAVTGDYVNIAEISRATDNRGVERPDEDSTPDAMLGDQGGTPEDPDEDNVITDSGLNDEDDQDPALISVVVDLALQKVVDNTTTPGPFYPGSQVAYTITVYNQGGIGVSNVLIEDYIPDVMSWISGSDGPVTSGGGSTINVTNNGAGTFTLDTLPPLDQLNLTITLKINQNFSGTEITNWAETRSYNNSFALTDVDSTPNAINFSESGETNDLDDDNVIDEDSRVGGDEDDHDPARITINPCPGGNCKGVTVRVNNE